MKKILFLLMVLVLAASPARGGERATGIGLKFALLPLEQFGVEEAFGYLRWRDFLGIEGLVAALEGGVRADLHAVSLEFKLLLIGFPVESGTIYPFTGFGALLELSPQPVLIPEGSGGLAWSEPPLLLFGELRIQTLRGMRAILGLGFEF